MQAARDKDVAWTFCGEVQCDFAQPALEADFSVAGWICCHPGPEDRRPAASRTRSWFVQLLHAEVPVLLTFWEQARVLGCLSNGFQCWCTGTVNEWTAGSHVKPHLISVWALHALPWAAQAARQDLSGCGPLPLSMALAIWRTTARKALQKCLVQPTNHASPWCGFHPQAYEDLPRFFLQENGEGQLSRRTALLATLNLESVTRCRSVGMSLEPGFQLGFLQRWLHFWPPRVTHARHPARSAYLAGFLAHGRKVSDLMGLVRGLLRVQGGSCIIAGPAHALLGAHSILEDFDAQICCRAADVGRPGEVSSSFVHLTTPALFWASMPRWKQTPPTRVVLLSWPSLRLEGARPPCPVMALATLEELNLILDNDDLEETSQLFSNLNWILGFPRACFSNVASLAALASKGLVHMGATVDDSGPLALDLHGPEEDARLRLNDSEVAALTSHQARSDAFRTEMSYFFTELLDPSCPTEAVSMVREVLGRLRARAGCEAVSSFIAHSVQQAETCLVPECCVCWEPCACYIGTCGHWFCDLCLGIVVQMQKPCPVCKASFLTLAQRPVLVHELRLRCLPRSLEVVARLCSQGRQTLLVAGCANQHAQLRDLLKRKFNLDAQLLKASGKTKPVASSAPVVYVTEPRQGSSWLLPPRVDQVLILWPLLSSTICVGCVVEWALGATAVAQRNARALVVHRSNLETTSLHAQLVAHNRDCSSKRIQLPAIETELPFRRGTTEDQTATSSTHSSDSDIVGIRTALRAAGA